MTDEERIAAAEELARDGETGAAIEKLWQLLEGMAGRQTEATLAARRRALEVLSAIAPADVEVACARARILLPDDVPGALGVIRTALRQAPRSIPVLRVLAEVHRTAGEDEKAIAAYEDVLRACREEIARGGGGLTAADKAKLGELGVYIRYQLWEKADETFRRFAERDTLDAQVHRYAAAIARAFERPPDRGAEHEIFALVLLAARHDPTITASFTRARGLYLDVALLPLLERRLLE